MMIESTNPYILAKRWFHRKDSAIFTVGYMDPSTPGSIIASAEKGDKIQLSERETKVEGKCEIKNFRFSAHSKRDELLSLVDTMQPENVILIHGDTTSIDWIGAAILKNYHAKKVFAASLGKHLMFD